MTLAGLWQHIGAGGNILTKFLRLIFLLATAASFYFLAVLPLNWPEQAVFGLLTLLLSMALSRSTSSYLITLSLMMMSMFCTFRYGFWRITQTIRFFQDPATHRGALDAFFILSLLLAETYAFVILFLGYFQTIWPLRRAPVPLPDSPEDWPHVDVLIPTYNEPLDVVRYTALGALNMDWPAGKLHIYILDDGRRSEFEQFAFEAGIGYKTRPDNRHAKAGNLNSALKSIDSPFVAVFDSDHVPTRSFLQMTIGWMLRDHRLAMLQTPHHFYSPDPFERNLGQFRVIPNEGELFYGIVQDGNDFWNATFFCGSCAVLRRSALDDIGGIAEETVTEDAHTSLRMQMKGWGTAYINIPQAAGLATERLSAHVGQRIRWARGMIQILRTDNPLFASGLTLPQRLCYFNAMCHFLYAVPRLIFLSAPLVFLLFGHIIIPGYWAAILAYALPHLMLSSLTNSRIQGQHRHSFWNEIYETVLSPYILLPTMLALIKPSLGKFNVTVKGGVVSRTFFDTRIAQPFLIMLMFNFAGLLIAIPRFFLWDSYRTGTVLMNALWCVINIVILGVTTAVAREMKQVRTAVRISVVTSVTARLADGRSIAGETVDMSSGGASIRFTEAVTLPPQAQVSLRFPHPAPATELSASVVSSEGSLLRVRFNELSIAEQEVLTMVLYSRADSWLGWGEAREADHVLKSVGRIFGISMRGLIQTAHDLCAGKNTKAAESAASSIVSSVAILALSAMFMGSSQNVLAQVPAKIEGQHQIPVQPKSGTQQQVPADSSAPPTSHFRNTPITVQSDLLPLADDVKQLPAPFLDPYVLQPPSIPIVFDAAPSYKAIQAAGVLSSYFGLLSEGRAVRFPVFIGTIPPGNVIVLSDNPSNLLASLNLPSISAPTVAMRTNPNDLYGKILVVAGAGADQLLIAAQAVAMHGDMLAGAQATIYSFQLPPVQKPDAAPRWARTDRKMSLSDYASAGQLQTNGSAPLNVYFRLPPDLFYPEPPNALLRLAYRYNFIPIGPASSTQVRASTMQVCACTMQVRMNNAFLGFVPLPPAQQASHKMQADLPVPVVDLRPFSNTLSFDFTFQLPNKSNRHDTTPINMQAAVLRDSYLDLRSYPHYAPLPNLEIFANAGFPFTRLADLSETTVVLPPAPTSQEIEAFLTLMGHFGRQTGFPVLRVTVAGPDALRQGARTDFLVIGADDDQPGFDRLSDDLPVSLRRGQIQVRDTQGFFAPLHRDWWRLNSSEHAESANMASAGTPDAVIEGIESPFDPRGHRSIVAIRLKDADAFEPFIATFLRVQQSSEISGSVSILHGTRFQSFRIGSEVYHVGLLPWWTRLTLWFTYVPWLAAILVFIQAFLFAVWTRQWLRNKARVRLKMFED